MGGIRLTGAIIFLKRPRFPKKSSQEFLLVDLMNNLDFLAENREEVRGNVAEKALSMDKSKLMKTAREFGGVRTKKFFEELFNSSNVSYA